MQLLSYLTSLLFLSLDCCLQNSFLLPRFFSIEFLLQHRLVSNILQYTNHSCRTTISIAYDITPVENIFIGPIGTLETIIITPMLFTKCQRSAHFIAEVTKIIVVNIRPPP